MCVRLCAHPYEVLCSVHACLCVYGRVPECPSVRVSGWPVGGWVGGWVSEAVKYCDPVNLSVCGPWMEDSEQEITSRTQSWTRVT